ncbi:MAG: AAA family ATPase [Gemmatimonadaceae bacterium]|nr:AAA family ATPase [Gemmatimonadaceae bacterium]MCW5826731.1 AAA family ATPase [Gemmatimonadaceae bacterium]
MAKKPVKPDLVRVRVLGKAEIHVGSRKIGMNTEAMFALALYLTTRAGERIPREELLEVFWPTGEEDARRHAMRQMLYRLRQKGLVFDEEGEFLRLDPSRVDSDLRECLAAEWAESAPAEVVEASLALGPTFSGRMPEKVLEWFDGVRSEVEAQQRRAAQRQVVQARREGRWADLDRWAKVILRSDPLNEEATLARAEATAMEGSKVAALGILDEYLTEVGHISSELGKPALSMRRRIAERRADWSAPSARDTRLIGRESTMQIVTACIEGAIAGKSTHSHLIGGPGIGKSRLLAEAREFGRVRGTRTIAVSAEPIMTTLPLALFQGLLRQLLDVPGAAAAPPNDINLLRKLVYHDGSFDPGAVAGPVAQTRDHIAAAASRLIRAIAEEGKLLVTIDDLHWADEFSAVLIGTLELAAISTNCAMICAYRPEALARLSAPLSQSAHTTVRIHTLSRAESRTLAHETLAQLHLTSSGHSLDRVVEAAGGNPLFLRELSLSQSLAVAAKLLPDTLQKVISSRLASLSELGVRTLRLITLLGDTATLARLRRLCATSHESLQHTIETLELDGMISARDTGVLQLHDCWKEAVVSSTPATLTMALALECAEDLEREAHVDDISLSRRVAHLLNLAGEKERALEHLIGASDTLYALGLVAETLSSLDSLAELASSPAPHARIAARRARAHLLDGDPATALEVAKQCLQSSALRDPRLAPERLSALVTVGEAELRLDMLSDGPVAEIASLARSGQLGLESRLRACLVGARLAVNRHNRSLLVELVEESRRLEDKLDAPSVAAWLTRVIGASELGCATDIVAAVSESPAQWPDSADVAERCHIERVACNALRHAGDLEGAARRGEAAFAIAIEHGLPHLARVAADALSFLFLDYCDTGRAEQWIDKGMKLDSVAAFGTTRTSAVHAQDRLWMQMGLFEKVAVRIGERLPIARRFGDVPSKLGELSLACYCFAKSGMSRQAAALSDELLELAPKSYGMIGSHFAVELTVRGLKTLGDDSKAYQVASAHMRRFRESSRPPVPPFYIELAALS